MSGKIPGGQISDPPLRRRDPPPKAIAETLGAWASLQLHDLSPVRSPNFRVDILGWDPP